MRTCVHRYISEPDVLHTTNEFRKSEDDTLDVSSMKSLTCCAQSVGLIVANNSTGTCFRVGVRYIMTTNHLIKEMLGKYVFKGFDQAIIDIRQKLFNPHITAYTMLSVICEAYICIVLNEVIRQLFTLEIILGAGVNVEIDALITKE